ncbi:MULTISPECIES: glutaredoxin family protein [Streptomyces]|uniref:glutaredoxin family protein n=1 Tax=Streptomyces TaxID=1883 RepID=UPI0018DF0954|nr:MULTISPECIES: glutaredoxin family protein [Streptomyces]MCZ4102798.1 glutaredoxin family protein [Streptomyces sp. H39-C1]
MPDATARTAVQVTLLTQADCALCDHAKQVLARIGADHLLHITEIGLATDEGRRLALDMGVLFAPGILLDGKPFAHGRLSERKLRRTLTTR